MGIEYVYFRAQDDDAAAAAERRPGGPLGLPEVTGSRRTGLFRREPVVTELGPAHEGFAVRLYDPMVTMGTLEALLTGRGYDDVVDDPRQGGAPSDDDPPEDRGVITLTDPLRDALAGADDERLAAVAGPWGQTEELQDSVPDEDHAAFLRRLRDLARAAEAHGDRLYCWFTL